MHRSLRALILIISLTVIIAGCGNDQDRKVKPGGKLAIFVSIAPQAYLVERIGGEFVETVELVKAGQNPHNFEISPRQMMSLSKAQVYFTIGMPFEAGIMSKIADTYKNLQLIDCTKGMKFIAGEDHAHHHDEDLHSKDETGEEHTYDPHVWLSPENLSIIAENITVSLASIDADNAETYRRNLKKFTDDLEIVDAKLKASLAPYRGKTFYVFHPSFGYFADYFGLKQKAVEYQGKTPTPRRLTEMIEQAQRDSIKIIFIQPQFDIRAAEAIAEATGGAVVPMDPLSRDILRNLSVMADVIELSFR